MSSKLPPYFSPLRYVAHKIQKSYDTILSSKSQDRELESTKQILGSQTRKLLITSFLIALAGVTLSMWGASWDITSHLLRTPETFFTPSHGILYLGVGISLVSAILCLAIIGRKKESRARSFGLGIKLIVGGSIMQIIAGPGDFYWHELFGIDGLMSPTHITLAIGIMIVLLGSIVGLARIRNFSDNNRFVNFVLPVSFGIFWFSVMWLIFFFVLPISEGDTHNFNPDQYFAIVLSFVALPFAFSVVFWSAHKTVNVFGTATAAATSFVVMNITSNIFTSVQLLSYMPWFGAPVIGAVISDYILLRSSIKHKEKIAGAILGSMFFVFCFPMLSMTFLEMYVYNDVFAYDVLPTSSDLVFEIWTMTIIPGAVGGLLGMAFASKKLDALSSVL